MSNCKISWLDLQIRTLLGPVDKQLCGLVCFRGCIQSQTRLILNDGMSSTVECTLTFCDKQQLRDEREASLNALGSTAETREIFSMSIISLYKTAWYITLLITPIQILRLQAWFPERILEPWSSQSTGFLSYSEQNITSGYIAFGKNGHMDVCQTKKGKKTPPTRGLLSNSHYHLSYCYLKLDWNLKNSSLSTFNKSHCACALKVTYIYIYISIIHIY